MKTPDEIKKGLECCKDSGECCVYVVSCPYHGGEPERLCMEMMAADALARIKQLEEALILMVYQYCNEGDGSVSHRWMTAGEHAFATLGIENYCSIEEIEKRLDEMGV